MTMACPDSIDVAALPPGYPAYLGYVDGMWPTAPELRKRFPAAHVIGLTVTGVSLDADGIDCEPGNPNAAAAAGWAARKLAVSPGARPVIYASVQGSEGYGMAWVRDQLAVHGVARSRVRLLSAHWGAGEHICGPATCKAINTPMDGTQWTDSYATGGAAGAVIDMSALADGFFGWTEGLVQQLPVVQQGDQGSQVRTVQGLCQARLLGRTTAVDGQFGPQTRAAVELIQESARIAVDGIVGQQTWPVLLGVA